MSHDHGWTRGHTIWLVLGTISLIAGSASYAHALTVTEAADGHTFVAHCIPLLADLTIFASLANMLDAWQNGERGRRFPWLSLASLGLSIAVTLWANVASGDPNSVPAWQVNVWPPVAFILALESLMGYYRRQSLRTAVRVTADGVPCPHGVPADLDEAVRFAYDHARDCEGSPLTFIDLGAAFGLDRKKVAKMVNPATEPVKSAAGNGHGEHVPEWWPVHVPPGGGSDG